MSDVETRDAIRNKIFDGCPLRTVIKKPCPYFGASKSCRDCTYDWLTIATEVRKVVESRRASYEKERSKAKNLKVELEKEKERMNQLSDVVMKIGEGLEAFRTAVELTQLMKSETKKEEEIETDKSCEVVVNSTSEDSDGEDKN